MTPEPNKVGLGVLERGMDFGISRTLSPCAEILYKAVKGMEAKFGGDPTTLVGLLLDGECVHPLVRRAIGRRSTQYVLGGKEFSQAFSIFDNDVGLGVFWRNRKGSTEETYPIYRGISGLVEDNGSLRIWADEGVGLVTKGVVLFPEDMVEKGSSVRELLQNSFCVRDHSSFVLVCDGLKRAGGLR